MTSEEQGQQEQTEDNNDQDGGEEAGLDATNEVVVKSFEDVLIPEGVLITISCIMGILLLLFIIICSLWCHYRRLQLREKAPMQPTFDIDLMAGSNSELQDLTNMLTDSANAYGMEISTDNSKVIVNTSGHHKTEVYINGVQFKEEARLIKAGVTRGSLDRIATAAKPSFKDINICVQDPEQSDDLLISTGWQSQIPRRSSVHRDTHRQSEIQMGLHNHRGTRRQSEMQPFTDQYSATGPRASADTHRQSEIQMGLHHHRDTRRQSEMQPFTDQYSATGPRASADTHRQSEIQMGLHHHRDTRRQSEMQPFTDQYSATGPRASADTHRQSEIQMGLHHHRDTRRQSEMQPFTDQYSATGPRASADTHRQSEIQMGLHHHRDTRRQSEMQPFTDQYSATGPRASADTHRQSEIQMGLHFHRGTQRESEIQMGLHVDRNTHRQSQIQMGLHNHRDTRRQSEMQPFTDQYRATEPKPSRAESVSPTNAERLNRVCSNTGSSFVDNLENPRPRSSLKETYVNYHVNGNNSPYNHSTGVSRNKGSMQEHFSTPETTKRNEFRKFSLDSPLIVPKEIQGGPQLPPSQHSNFQNAREHIDSEQQVSSPQHIDNANSREHIGSVQRQKSFQNKNFFQPNHRLVVKALHEYWKKKELTEDQREFLPKSASSLKPLNLEESPRSHVSSLRKLFTPPPKTCCPESSRSWIDKSPARRQLRFQKASSVPLPCKCPISQDMPRCSSPKPSRCLIDKSTANSLQKAFCPAPSDCPKCCQCLALSCNSPTCRMKRAWKMTTTDRPCTCTMRESASQRRPPEFNRPMTDKSPVNSEDCPCTHRLPSQSCSSVSSPRLVDTSQKMDTTRTCSVSQVASQSCSEASECMVDRSPIRRVSSLCRAFSPSTVPLLSDTSERYSSESDQRRRKFHKP